MNSTILLLLLLFCFLIWNANIASAVDIQTSPIVQSATSPAPDDKKPANVGPRDPNKEKSHGVGVNVLLSKNVAVSGSVSLLPSASSVLSGQSDPNNMLGTANGLGLRTSQVGGAVGFKLFF